MKPTADPTSDALLTSCLTVTQAPVVVSHTVRMEMFWARFSHLTDVLVLLIHFTMVT